MEEDERRRRWLKPEPLPPRPLTKEEKRTLVFAENAVQHHDQLAAKNVEKREELAAVQRGILLARLPPRPATRQGGEGESLARMASAATEGAVSKVKWDKGQAMKKLPTRESLRQPASGEPADAEVVRADEEQRSEKMSGIFSRGPAPRHKERAAVWDEAEGQQAGVTSGDAGSDLSWIDRIPDEAVVVPASYRQRAKPGMGLTEAHLSPIRAAKGGGGEKGSSIMGAWLDDSLGSARLSPNLLVSGSGGVTFGKVASASSMSSMGLSVERGEEASGDAPPRRGASPVRGGSSSGDSPLRASAASAAPVDRSETPAETPTTHPKTLWARLPSREGKDRTSSQVREKGKRMLPAPDSLTLVDGSSAAMTPEQAARLQERLRPKNLVSRGLAKLGLRW